MPTQSNELLNGNVYIKVLPPRDAWDRTLALGGRLDFFISFHMISYVCTIFPNIIISDSLEILA